MLTCCQSGFQAFTYTSNGYMRLAGVLLYVVLFLREGHHGWIALWKGV